MSLSKPKTILIVQGLVLLGVVTDSNSNYSIVFFDLIYNNKSSCYKELMWLYIQNSKPSFCDQIKSTQEGFVNNEFFEFIILWCNIFKHSNYFQSSFIYFEYIIGLDSSSQYLLIRGEIRIVNNDYQRRKQRARTSLLIRS